MCNKVSLIDETYVSKSFYCIGNTLKNCYDCKYCIIKQKKLKTITEREMFEKSFERPSNFFKLSGERQWEIDKSLGILDWMGEGLSDEDKKRFKEHYD